jgi:hypothetical protein
VTPSRERLRHAITARWETSAVIAERASVNRNAAGTMLAALTRHRADVERRPVNGRWEYRRRAT